jgi:hypothetical protein
LAEALERLHEDDPASVAGELVRQYHASATLPGADRGAGHALAAGREARAAGAPGDAVMILRLGLDLVGEDTEVRPGVLGELARAEAEAGLFADAARTLEAAVSALEHRRGSGEAIAELVYAVGVAFTLAVVLQSFQETEPLIERALSAIGQTHSIAWARLKLLQRFGQPETIGPLRVVRLVRFDPEAVRIARSEGTEVDYAFTVESRDPAFGAELEQLIARIDGWRDPVARVRALINVVSYLALAEPGSSPAADRLSAQLRALADDVGLLPTRALARVFRGALHGGRGEFDAAAEQIDQASALLERQPMPGAMAAVVTLVEALTAQHVAADWPRLGGVMWNLARNPGEAGWPNLACAAFAAYAFARAGEVGRARSWAASFRRSNRPSCSSPSRAARSAWPAARCGSCAPRTSPSGCCPTPSRSSTRMDATDT